jgi:hypothetical protein
LHEKRRIDGWAYECSIVVIEVDGFDLLLIFDSRELDALSTHDAQQSAAKSIENGRAVAEGCYCCQHFMCDAHKRFAVIIEFSLLC